MQSETLSDALTNGVRLGVSDHTPALPSPRQRWTVQHKAAVIEAVRRGRVTIEEARQIYYLSVEELVAWERDVARYGIPGLRATQYQIYRHTEARMGR